MKNFKNCFRPAKEYIDELNECFKDIQYNKKYKYVLNENGTKKLMTEDDFKEGSVTYLVWLDNEKNIAGYFEYCKMYNTKTFFIDFLITFTDNSSDTVNMMKEIYKIILENFIGDYDLEKLQWGFTIGNPVERGYKKLGKILSQKYNMIFTYYDFYNGIRTFDGELLDQRIYQILKPDMILKRKGEIFLSNPTVDIRK